MTFGLDSLKQMFSEDNGNLSSMRLLSTLIVVIVLGNWTWFNITNNTIAGFDVQDIGLVLGALGIKGWQKRSET